MSFDERAFVLSFLLRYTSRDTNKWVFATSHSYTLISVARGGGLCQSGAGDVHGLLPTRTHHYLLVVIYCQLAVARKLLLASIAVRD